MTRKEKLEALKLLYTETDINDLLAKISPLDKSRELVVWKYIIDKNKLYELILKVKNIEELNELTKEINEYTFLYNDYFYKDSDNYGRLYGVEHFKEEIIENLEYDLWTYFESLEEPNE